TSNTAVVEACDSYYWAVNGFTYTESGSYDVTNGCHTEILELIITPSTSNTAVVEACDSYYWAVNGFTYTESGSYDVTNGCHTEILELTITPSTSNTAVVEACDSYTWAVNGFTYTESGSYDVTNGCHTEILELTISLPVNILDEPADQNLVEGTTASFSVVAENAATYQWQGSIDGGANWIDIPEGSGISGTDTNTLTIDGTVVTTDISGLMVRAFMTNGTCSTAFTNSAVLSVTLGTNTAALNNLSIYPNPTRNLVNLSTNGVAAKITVSDINGRLIHSAASQTGEAQIDLSNVQAGIYLFTITTDYGVVNKKVIKE
ncbi:T9SS type A sorting domain-containing protein, partial [Flavobacterium sp.]|uniref:T9SS type A sorting domain-containing protein n=1 Tax=Flavobacterium sp. TaxID=239 RepID=UPI00261BE8D4